MENMDQKIMYRSGNTKNVLVGLLVGGLAGAAAMLLLAPQSGKQTRDQIQAKGIELRDLTTRKIGKAVEQVHAKTGELTEGVREKAEELKHLGQDQLVKQLDRVSAALDTGKAAPKTS